MLKTGGKYYPRLDATLIEDDWIRAYLIHLVQTSEEAGPNDIDYPTQWQQIQDTVGTLVPTLKDASRWKDIPYIATDNKLELDMSPEPRERMSSSTTQLIRSGGGQGQLL